MTVYYDDSIIHNVYSIHFVEDVVSLFNIEGEWIITINRDQLVSIITDIP